MADTTSIVSDLVQGFAKHIKLLRSKETVEATIRQNYIDPFWSALGWDVGDKAHRGPSEAEVIIEKTVETLESEGLRNRRPDYLFRLSGFPRFVVEAKRAAINIDEDRDAIFQTKQYAWNSTIPFAILTNFAQFRLYDTTLKPIIQEPSRGLIKEFSLDYVDYLPQWDVLAEVFGRDSVAGGSLESLLAKVKKIKSGRRIRTVDRMLLDIKGGEPVDRVFLSYLDSHRRHFAADIYGHNKLAFPEADTLHGAAKLTEAVQRIMDRLVFLRVCEDRGIIRYGSLRETLERVGEEGGEFYDSLTASFREMDSDYNGYLFKPHFSEQLRVSGSVLADFTRTLYPPDGPWDFAAIGDDILGIVYERFLGNVVRVKQGRADIEEKPEVRHAGGVYYTPRFIVDSIIRRVIGPKIRGKTPAEVLNVKILDPACGSGTFLVAALQYLFDYCVASVYEDPALARATVPALTIPGAKSRKKRSEIAFQDRDGHWNLAPDFRAALLTHCIHGVDIDQQAVEVTVMSLYLKLLEAKLPENWAKLWVEKQLLPSLDNNIRCGNSLIDEESYYQFREVQGKNQLDLFDRENEDTRFRINRFDWRSETRGFGRVLTTHRGFDCIIGNPPYVRVQELSKWEPEECEFYKWYYASAKEGGFDIYVVFVERGLTLLAPKGLLGFITPHKFWQAAYGVGLRRIIAERQLIHSIVNFGHQQVFQKATTYTAIHVLGSGTLGGSIPYSYFDKLEDGVSQCSVLDETGATSGVTSFMADHPVDESPWHFVKPELNLLLKKASAEATHTLGDISRRLFQGIRTSKNEVFVLTKAKGETGSYFSEELAKTVSLESAVLRPFLKGDHIRRYEVVPPDAVAIFPYRLGTGKAKPSLLAEDELRRIAPLTYSYLKECEDVLRARDRGRMKKGDWYAYGRTQNLDLFGVSRILVHDTIEAGKFAIDREAEAAFVSGYGIILKREHEHLIDFICGLLNSKLINAFLKSVSTPLRGGWMRTFPQFLRRIPIKLPESDHQLKIADQIVNSVRSITNSKLRLHDPGLSDRQRNQHAAEIETNEDRIDNAVHRLYGVDQLPVQ